MLKASVSLAIKLDLDDLKSAAYIWTHCEHLHALNTVENQREVRRQLYFSETTRRLRRWRPTWSCSRG
jgi:CRISPR/Cas system-associated protein Cas10 (large subunit of type III CRISPR-Cas system)